MGVGRLFLTALLAGCATAGTASGANRASGAIAPCPAPSAAPSGTNSPTVLPGAAGILLVPVAIGLAVAGASSSTARCTAATSPAAPAAANPVEIASEPASFPAGSSPEFVCNTPDGEEDTIVAPSRERAVSSCAVMTGEVCTCRSR